MAWYGIDGKRKVITTGFIDQNEAMRAVLVKVGHFKAARLEGLDRDQLVQLMRSVGNLGYRIVHSNATQVVGKPYKAA